MAKVTLPPDVTPLQLDAVFRKLLKLPPQYERAVRLRLEGKTYKEIVSVLNAECQPNGKQVELMWVNRRCRSVANKLSQLASAHMNIVDGPNTTVYGIGAKISSSLDQGKQKHNRAMLPPKPKGKRKKLYTCHTCSSENLQSQPNVGGKRNSRIHVCLKCGRVHTTAERNAHWSYVSMSLQPQKYYVPFPDEDNY